MCLINVEEFIAADHRMRVIKRLLDEVLEGMSGRFEKIYAREGRPSVPPETLLKGKAVQALYTNRSDRQLQARLQTDLLFRWLSDVVLSGSVVDLPLDKAAFDASSYSKNQDRLLKHEVADLFFSEVVELARRHRWVSSDHFSVDGTLIDAWASMKSFKAKGSDQGPGSGNPWSDFKGGKRSNATHASTTDPEAKLMRKGPGKESRLCFAAHATMGSAAARPHDHRSARRARREPRQNRHGLCVLFDVRPAAGEPESSVAVEQAAELRNRGLRPKTMGADKGYHTREFIEGMRDEGIRPHPALKAGQDTLRVVLTAAHAASQKVRKRIEVPRSKATTCESEAMPIFGWTKTTGGFRKSRYQGVARTHAAGQYVVATWNLLRMAKIMTSAPPGMARA